MGPDARLGLAFCLVAEFLDRGHVEAEDVTLGRHAGRGAHLKPADDLALLPGQSVVVDCLHPFSIQVFLDARKSGDFPILLNPCADASDYPTDLPGSRN